MQKPRRPWRAIMGALLLLGILGGIAWLNRDALVPALDALRQNANTWLQAIPIWAYLLAFATLPIVGFPLTLFYLTAPGLLGGPYGAYGIVAAWGCLGINMTLHYWLVRAFRGWALRLMARRNFSLTLPDERQQVRILVMVRISPIPYALQNIGLAVAGYPFARYLLYSWPIQGGIGLSIMLVGESLFSGGFQGILLGATLFLLLWILLPILRKRLSRGEAAPGEITAP